MVKLDAGLKVDDCTTKEMTFAVVSSTGDIQEQHRLL